MTIKDFLRKAGYNCPARMSDIEDWDDNYDLIPVETKASPDMQIFGSRGWMPCGCTPGTLTGAQWVHRRLKPGLERVEIRME